MQKKKKKLVWITLGIAALAGIGVVVYFAWPKGETKTENKQPTNSREERIKQLQNQLISLRSELNNIQDATKKIQLENRISNLEGQVNNSLSQSAIEELERKIKEIRKEQRGDEPSDDEPKPGRKEGKFTFYGNANEKSGYVKFADLGSLFYISNNHPQIKKLLSKGKLQENKKFTIRYGKEDEISDKGSILTFNENNQELEIIEVKSPGPEPNPNPQNNEYWNFISTKINDNCYKYHLTLLDEKIDFRKFIMFLESSNLSKGLFLAFQEALKDANTKFPGYFWECPPVSKKTLDKTFEFVVIKSEGLANANQNYSDYNEYLKDTSKEVHSFPSPKKDGILVIPGVKNSLDYKNLSQFTENAPDEQQQELWKEVAKKLSEELKKNADAPRWLSTHGSGIAYLHVRIYDNPKYYSYKEYKEKK